MSNPFDIDNPVWSKVSKVIDIIILNFLFLLCCIPVFTISTSFTALYFTALRIVSGTETYVSAEFFKSFKSNFKQAFLSGVIVFDGAVILAVITYFSYIYRIDILRAVMVVVDVMYAAVVSYVYPLLAKFTLSNRQLLLDSVLMAFRHFPYTLLNLAVWIGVGFCLYARMQTWAVFLVFGFALVALLQSLWFQRIFHKYMTGEEIALNEEFKEEEKMAKQEKKQKRYRS